MKFATPILRNAVYLMLVGAASSHAADSVSLAYATGNSTRMARIGAQWKWDKQWRVSDGVHVGGYWDLTLAQWRGTRYRSTDRTQNITDIGFTPVFRIQKDSRAGWYGEGALAPICFRNCTTTVAASYRRLFSLATILVSVMLPRTAWISDC